MIIVLSHPLSPVSPSTDCVIGDYEGRITLGINEGPSLSRNVFTYSGWIVNGANTHIHDELTQLEATGAPFGRELKWPAVDLVDLDGDISSSSSCHMR